MSKQKGRPPKPPANGTPPPATEPERLPAYFLSLTVENVRCFGPKQTLDLSDGNGKPAPWTIILGLNGTGKTTLLQSLAGFERSQSPIANDPIGGYWGRFLAYYRDEPRWYRRSEAPSNWEVNICGSKSLASLPTSHVAHVFQIGKLGAMVMEPSGEPISSPWCCAYGASRRIGLAYFTGTGWTDDPTGTLFSDNSDLRNPEEWLLGLDYTVKSNRTDTDAQRQLNQVKELLLQIMPEGEVTNLRCLPGTGQHYQPRVEFQTPYGWVPLRQLGYGYQTLITWVADLANRMAERYTDSANPLAEPAVVLVDEIDLHLHPIWQRKLMGFLRERFPNTQFIATAHSPLVAQAAAEANLAVLRREGDHVVIDNEVDNIRNWRIDQILTSDLFGLETARPPHIEALLMEQKAILTKPKLNAVDKRRLEELDAQIGPLPTGENAQEVREREEIRKTLELLMKERKPTS